jgi:hypothetical protein
LDQEEMELQLALGNDEAYANALKIYSEGAYSKSTAKVTLSAAIGSAISKGTAVTGKNAAGNQVIGKTYEDYASGATDILVQYQTTDSQKNYVDCQVGASLTPNTVGCFAASGSMAIDGVGDATYTYDPLSDNINKRSIQGFSTAAKKKMAECENCPYKMYEKFYDYYGQYDYANQITLAAMSGQKTNFDNFDMDMGLYGFDGRTRKLLYIILYIYLKWNESVNLFVIVIPARRSQLHQCTHPYIP